MSWNASVLAGMLVALSAPNTSFAQAALSSADRTAIAAHVERVNATARRAWEARDPSLLVPDSPSVFVRTPQGQLLTATDLRADLQRRMNMTTRVDTLIEVLDSIRVVRPDSVLAYTSQRFVRVIRLPEGVERQRLSTVIHEIPMVRRELRWAQAGPLREINPKAWWAGEPLRGHFQSRRPANPFQQLLCYLIDLDVSRVPYFVRAHH